MISLSIAALPSGFSTDLSKSNSALRRERDLLHRRGRQAGAGAGARCGRRRRRRRERAGAGGRAPGPAARGFGTRSGSHCAIAIAGVQYAGAPAQVARQARRTVVNATLDDVVGRRRGSVTARTRSSGTGAVPGTYPAVARCDRTAGERGGKRADNYTGDETSSHCFTPLALVLNKLLFELALSTPQACDRCRAATNATISRNEYSTRVLRVAKKSRSSEAGRRHSTVAAIQRRDKIS